MAAGGRGCLPRLDGPGAVHPEASTVRDLRCNVHGHPAHLHSVLPCVLPVHRSLRNGLLRPLAEPGNT